MYKVVGSVQPVSEDSESKETCYEIDREGASCPVGEAGDSLRGVKDGRCVLSEDYVCAVVHRDDGRYSARRTFRHGDDDSAARLLATSETSTP